MCCGTGGHLQPTTHWHMNPSILMKDFKSDSFRTLSKALSFRNLSVIPMHWAKVPSSPGTKQIWEGCELDFSFSSPLLNLFGYFIHVYLYINAFQYYLPPTFSSPSFWLSSSISRLFLHLRLLPISHYNCLLKCWLFLLAWSYADNSSSCAQQPYHII